MSIKTLAVRRPFGFYYGLALLIVCGVMAGFGVAVALDPTTLNLLNVLFECLKAHGLYANAPSIAYCAIEGPHLLFLVLVFAVAPTLAAIITARIVGDGALQQLFRRLKPFQPEVDRAQALRVYAVILGVYALGIAFLMWQQPSSEFELSLRHFGNWATLPVAALIGMFIDEGGALEELGWRGFALPTLQQKMDSPLKAALVLGTLWWAWHFPRDLFTVVLGGADVAFWVNQWSFLVLCVSLAIVMAYACNRTGGSVLPAMMIHGGTNVWSKAIGMPQAHILGMSGDLRYGIVFLAAVLVVALSGRRLGLPGTTTSSPRFEKRMAAVFAVLTLGCFFVGPPAPAPRPHPGAVEVGQSQQTAQAAAVAQVLSEFVQQQWQAMDAPGISVAAILPDQTVVTAAYGWADPAARVPMTATTHLMSGSTGKTFCAAVIMSLVDEHKLDLDAPLAPLFKDEPWFSHLPNSAALTPRLLLNHTEGFPQFLDEPRFIRSFATDTLLGRDTGYPPEKMLSFILYKPPLSAPGAQFNYSDLGYHLLGLTIEKITGRSYYDVLAERVLKPLKLTEVIPAVRKDLPNLAAGYASSDLLMNVLRISGRQTDEQGHLKRNPALEYTGGGLELTPRALAQFYFALLHAKVVSAAGTARMLADGVPITTTDDSKTRYGFGLFVTERPEFGTYVSHSGYYPGYNSNVGYFEKWDTAIAIQVNRDHVESLPFALRDLASRVGKVVTPAVATH